MKPRKTFKLLGGIALLIAGLSDAYSVQQYVMKDLGTLAPPGTWNAPLNLWTDYVNSAAYAINENGVIAGNVGMYYSEVPTTPFMYSNNTMTNLGRNGYSSDNIVVADINNNNQIVGGTGFGVIYQNGSWTSLGTGITPAALNDNGVIVGSGSGAAKYYSAGSWYNFSFAAPYYPTWSQATAITNDGVMIGNAQVSIGYSSGSRIFNAGANGNANFAMYSSGSVHCSMLAVGTSCYAYDAVDASTLQNAAVGTDNANRALLFGQGDATLLSYNGQARGINSHGQVVGWRLVNGQEQAFLWDNGEILDLGTLGGSISRAYDINDAGQIVGYAMLPGNTAYHAFLAEPVPEPETWAMLLAGLGLVGFRLRQRAG